MHFALSLSLDVIGFTQPQLTILSKLPIVPTKGSGAQQLRWLTPTQCYLGDGTKGEFHSKLFVFVDFGPVANRFLSACGSKSEPSIDEVAEILISDPKKFYELSGGYERYVNCSRSCWWVAHLVGSQLLGRVAQPGCQQPCYQHWHGEQDEHIAHLAWYASPENVENVENVIGQGGMG